MTLYRDLDSLPFDQPEADASPALSTATPRRHRHVWIGVSTSMLLGYSNGFPISDTVTRCQSCGIAKDEATSRRGRNNRSRGNRAELAVARKYGGEKTGPLGQPEDIRGKDFRTQVKTHQGLPPAGWRSVFAALDTQHDSRLPRLIERYLPGQGIAADDYIVIRGSDWLLWFGRDDADLSGRIGHVLGEP